MSTSGGSSGAPSRRRRAIIQHIARGIRTGEQAALHAARPMQGLRFARQIKATEPANGSSPAATNPLEAYFDANLEGPGIWKWRHYFDIYHRHFAKFIGQRVNIVEIGIFSGGSLGMWRHYFGERATVYGVDIQDVCRAYESESVKVFIGDQADPHFWSRFCEQVPEIDIVIDDGGHESEQQIATLEALLPRMRPGGVFVCEDLIGTHNSFHRYACGMSRGLNASNGSTPNGLQRSVESVSFYPYLTVIERRTMPLEKLAAPRHGTEWQPYFDHLDLEKPVVN